MTPDLIEKMARAICELRIREVRKFDRTQEEIDQQIQSSVDYAWGGWVPEATAALSVALEAIGEECIAAVRKGGGPNVTANEIMIRTRIAEMKARLTSV